MNRPRRAIAWAALFVMGALITAAPGITHALGLGNLRVNSALNESLNAEIDFTSISKKELKSLNVTLASRGDFDTAGVERLAYLFDIKFTVSKRLDGRSFLQLSSEQPIREPFLHFLLQVEWAGGRLIREFTALIDPPYLVASKPASIQVPQTPAPRVEPVPPLPPVAAATPAPATTTTVEPLPPTSAVVVPAPVVEPLPLAESAPALVEPAPRPQAPPVQIASAEPELLGPPELADPTVAISPESGWPVITTGAGTMTAAAAPGSETLVEPLPAESAMGPARSWASVAEYEVKRGDTLWEIADKIRVDRSLTIEQVVMALYEANPDAFFRNNVNNVYAGKVLRVPERLTVDSLPARQARKVFFAQYDEWQAYQVKLASASQPIMVAEAPEEAMEPAMGAPATLPAEAPQVAEKPTEDQKQKQTQVAQIPRAEEQPVVQEAPQLQEQERPKDGAGTAALAAKAKPSGDLLKIVRAAIEREGRSQKGGVAEGESVPDSEQAERLALAERATTLEESLDSKQMEQQQLSERIGTVGSQIEKQKRLIELENEALAKTQPPAADTAKSAQAPAPKAAPAKPQAPAKPAQTPAVAAKPKPKAPPKKPRPIAPPPPPEQQSILATIQDMLGDYLMQAVTAIIAVVVGLILMVHFRRRRQAEAEFEESILTDSGTATTGETASTTNGAQMATSSGGSTSFLSDFSQGGMGNISTDEVDPLAETEVYLAYGRDEQAEEILKEAVTRDPGRHELKVKLLDIYHQRNDVAAFETLAEELYAALEGRGGDLWNQVAEMGRKLNPENPMFQGVMPAAGPSIPASPAPMLAEPAPVALEPEAPAALDFEPAGAEAPSEAPAAGLELDIGAESQEEAPADTKLEFDLDMETAAEETPKGPHLGDTAELEGQDVQASDLAAEAGVEPVGLGEQPGDNVVDYDISEGRAEPATEEPSITGGQEGDTQWDLDTAAALETAAEAAADLAIEAPADTEPPGEDTGQQWDETATKLDLAKAYVDMGDAEGARSILDEVMAEGNQDQKKQAAELAAQIA